MACQKKQADKEAISINARQVFGLTRGKVIPGDKTNYIDVSSQFNQSGTITINTPDVDPSRGLVELPTAIVNLLGSFQHKSTIVSWRLFGMVLTLSSFGTNRRGLSLWFHNGRSGRACWR